MYAQRRIKSKEKSGKHYTELVNLNFEKLVEHYFHVLVYYSNKNNEDINEKLDKLFEKNKNDAYTDDTDKNGNKIHMIHRSIPKWKFDQLRKKYPYEYVHIPSPAEKRWEEKKKSLKESSNIDTNIQNKYFETYDKLHSNHSDLETYVREKGNVSLGKTPALTLLKQGNLFRVKYRYPFIPGSFEQNYSTEMNTNTLTFNPGTTWKDKPKPSKTSMIPFKTKHDEANYVKVVFNVNLKAPNKSNMQKFVIHVPKTSLTYTDKLSEVNLQFKDLYEPKNSKIINGKASKGGMGRSKSVKFFKPLDILIPGTQDCMVNSVDSGVFSSLESIKARQAKEANQRINKLKIDLRKSKMNEGDATLCTNKIRDMEADLLENNAMTISYDPASKNVYVSKVENLTDFAESLKINLEELHDVNSKTQDPVAHQANVENNKRLSEIGSQPQGSNSSTIHTPGFIKKAMGPKSSSGSSSGSSSSGSSSYSSSSSSSKKPDKSKNKKNDTKKEAKEKKDKKEEDKKEEGEKKEDEKKEGEKKEGEKQEGEKEEGENNEIEKEVIAVVEASHNETTIPEPSKSKSIENPESNN